MGRGREWSEQKQMRWSGLNGVAHLHPSRSIFGTLRAQFIYDFPHVVFDIIERDLCDSVSMFLLLLSQKDFSCFQSQLKISQSRGVFIFHFARADRSSVPGDGSAHICGGSEEKFSPLLLEFKKELDGMLTELLCPFQSLEPFLSTVFIGEGQGKTNSFFQSLALVCSSQRLPCIFLPLQSFLRARVV